MGSMFICFTQILLLDKITLSDPDEYELWSNKAVLWNIENCADIIRSLLCLRVCEDMKNWDSNNALSQEIT